MKNHKHILRGIVVSLAIAARLMNPVSVQAGGGAPPHSSETPAATSTAEPAQVIPTESPTPEPTQLVPTKPGIDRIPTKLVPPNPMDTSTPTPPSDPTEHAVESATSTPDPTGKVEKPTLTDVLQDLQGDTSVVVLDENGQPLPLVSQTTADIVAQGDPMWCPEGIAPGGAGCTSAYATLTDLLSNAGTYINSQNVNGVIWITSGTIADANPITIDGATYTNWSNYNLTLQGGWSGINGDTTIGANSVFFVPITITNWNNGITIQNISVDHTSVTAPQGGGISITNVNGNVNLDNIRVDGAIGPGLQVITSGAIQASNISSLNNRDRVSSDLLWPQDYGLGAYLDSQTSLTLTGTNVFSGNTQDGLLAFSAGDLILSNVTAGTNGGNGIAVGSWNGNATLSDIDVYDNGYLGLSAYAAYDLALHNVTADRNFYGAFLSSSYGGVTMTGKNAFNGNEVAGASIGAAGDITLYHVTTQNNGWTGLEIYGAQNVTLNDVVTNGNGIGVLVAFAGNVNFSGGSITNNITGLYITCIKGLIYNSPPINISGNVTDIFTDNWGCPPPPPPPQPQTFLQTQGELFTLDCITAQHRYVVRLANGDRGEIFCPVNGKASIDRVDNTTLPATLPAGYMYASAFDVKILQNDRPIFVIAEEGYITASFLAQQPEAGNAYSILYWDDQNKTWIPLKDLLRDAKGEPETFPLYPDDAEDTRKILSGVNLVTKNGESRVEVSTNFPGIFVLAQH